MKNNYVGETKVLNNGKEATIIAFRDFYDMDVQLCTGEVSEHVQYYDFQRCDAAALGFTVKEMTNESYEVTENTEIAYLYLMEG